MREFKFRAYCRTDGVTYCFSIHSSGLVATMNNEWLPDNEKPIIMQYIGVRDINNKPIYEGDIVKAKWQHCGVTNYDYEITGIIKYNSKIFAFLICEEKNNVVHFIGTFAQEKLLQIEVIGNVYENPEILQGSSQNDIQIDL